jgi:RNA polymerase sigma-70 factor (ECF subfamily)
VDWLFPSTPSILPLSVYALGKALTRATNGRSLDAVARPDPDEVLVGRIAAGDEQALREIVRRHAGRLTALALRFSRETAGADDIVQETFWTLWRHAARWKPGGAPFSAWLTRVAVNRAIDFDRRRRVRRFFGLEEASEVTDPAIGAEERLAKHSDLAAVAADIRALPSRQRVAILLAAGGDRSNADIAAIMGLSLGATEQLLVRARRTLRNRLALRNGATETGR